MKPSFQLTTPPQAVGVCKRNYPIIFPLTLTLSLRERELVETPPQADGVLKEFNKRILSFFTKIFFTNAALSFFGDV